jgi:OHCU decarboxylase
MHSLAELNRADRTAFVAALGAAFEHSPWVAERAFTAQPFATVAALHAAMLQAVRVASRVEQLALIRAHPELAGREAAAGALSADSATEQGRLGINALSRPEFERMRELNRRYSEKFGFPCIIALRLHADRASVLAEFERRLANGTEAEIEDALAQIGHITRGRLEKLVRED